MSRIRARYARIPTRVAVVALVVYWTALAIGTHLPPPKGAKDTWLDKPLHFGAFFGLACLLGTVLYRLGLRVWIVVPILMTYAICDELSQIPFGRSAEALDFVCDSIGAIAGTLFVRWLTQPLPADDFVD